MADRASHQQTLRVTGQVQGVGFRPHVYRLATELGLTGSVRNDPTGVTIVAVGPRPALEVLRERIEADAPALARVDAVSVLDDQRTDAPPSEFTIAASDARPGERGRVTVDAATCDDCLHELADPSDRRYRHALINCTNCGPRYTIVRDLPYDRPQTTMAEFAMCADCAAEYRDPADRRFHAQPTCCRACGPQLRLLDADGGELGEDPIEGAVRVLEAGAILAMKGLGGYHLVVDATSTEALKALRRAKRRDEKPFAVMVPHLASARARAKLSPAGERQLTSPQRPIVLARAADDDRLLADGVAPACHRVGLMLPYTPMQHLLLDALPRPLVMTSANESDDPLIKDDREARRRLGGYVAAFLVHDRPIERAVDDSIVLDGPRGIVPVRRARGLVPTPLGLPVAAPRPGLAVGGELKNTVAVVRGDAAVLGQHLGDLTYSLAYERFLRTIEDLERLFEIEPAWIACDRHPDYLSAVEARRRAEATGIPLITVQHHHAHHAAVLADHGREAPALGLICDGVGWGDDGTSWGGEVLVGDLLEIRRLGRLRPLRLPGGDAAARETGRPALAWLFDLLGPSAGEHQVARRALPDAARRATVLAMLTRDVHCPRSSGLGRLFDAAAALLGVCLENRHEAMSGMRLEAEAARATARPSGDGLVTLVEVDDLFEMDPRPLLETLLADGARGTPVPESSWRFHDAIAGGLASAARRAREQTGLATVTLAGGVFLNTLLDDLVRTRLERDGFDVLTAIRVPPNDGAIAYGQAAVAAARLARRCAQDVFLL